MRESDGKLELQDSKLVAKHTFHTSKERRNYRRQI